MLDPGDMSAEFVFVPLYFLYTSLHVFSGCDRNDIIIIIIIKIINITCTAFITIAKHN